MVFAKVGCVDFKWPQLRQLDSVEPAYSLNSMKMARVNRVVSLTYKEQDAQKKDLFYIAP